MEITYCVEEIEFISVVSQLYKTMTQRSKTVEQFFGYKDPRPPEYFVIRQRHSRSCGYKACFETTRQMQKSRASRAVGTVNWPQAHCSITLRIEEGTFTEGPFVPDDTSPYNAAHLKMLKSNLQKAVRRCETEIAINTAHTIMCLSPVELAQRLGIIWIEDACLTRDYPVLVWIMAALTKGHVFTEGMARLLLMFSHHIASLPERDVCGYREKPVLVRKVTETTLDSEWKSMLYSVLFRRGYQSLAGDKLMIDQCVGDWMDRMVNNPKLVSEVMGDQRYFVARPSILGRKQWIDAAIDQHCSGVCAQTARLCKVREPEVRKVVWKCSSRLTKKLPARFSGPPPELPTEKERELWETIEETVRRGQRQVLDRIWA